MKISKMSVQITGLKKQMSHARYKKKNKKSFHTFKKFNKNN